MKIYKVKFEVIYKGFFFNTYQHITEIFTAKDILDAKDKARKYINEAIEEWEDTSIPLIHMRPHITIEDIEEVK